MASGTAKGSNGDSHSFETLRAEVILARKAFEEASRVHAQILADIPSGLPHKDGTLRIKQAGEEFRRAMRAYSRAVYRLDEFVRTGRLPDDEPDI